MKTQGHRFFRKLNCSKYYCAPVKQPGESQVVQVQAYFENEWWCFFSPKCWLSCWAGEGRGMLSHNGLPLPSLVTMLILLDTNICSCDCCGSFPLYMASTGVKISGGFCSVFLDWNLMFTFQCAPSSCSVIAEGGKSSNAQCIDLIRNQAMNKY